MVGMVETNGCVTNVKGKAYVGSFYHSPKYGELEGLVDTLLVVKDGKIVHIGPAAGESAVLEKYDVDTYSIKRLKDGQFFLPGFIDTHVHAPQYKFSGTATDLPLLEWLTTYTFPTEAGFQDRRAALSRYTLLLKRFLANGTTTAMYYGTIHLEPNKLLVDLIEQAGQRAVVGKVCMDQNSIDTYVEDTERSLAESEEFIQYVRGKAPKGSAARIDPCITPRFIPTCSMPLLKGLSAMAAKHSCHIQSHISECCGEVNWVKELHPKFGSDANLFDELGLLTDKAVMAHGTFLSEDDMKLMARRGAAVSHCPLSNFFVGDACFKVNQAVALGVKVGLGTDVAGGMSASMLNSMRMAVVNSRALRAYKIAASGGTTVTPDMETDVISFREALWLATVGSAEALNLADRVGTFVVGKEFDALLVDPMVPGGPFDVFEDESPELVVEKFLNLGDDRNILEVYVQGNCVKQGDHFAMDFSGLSLDTAETEPEQSTHANGDGVSHARLGGAAEARKALRNIDGDEAEIRKRLEACRAKRLRHL